MEKDKIKQIQDDDEMVIDLWELLLALRKRLLTIIAVALLGGCLGCAYTLFLASPVYTSTSSLLVLTKETTLSSLADLQIGSQLTNDYRVLATSRPVLEEVIENLGMTGNYKQLRQMISIENPEDTRILEITVTHSDPEAAQKIVNELTEVAAAFIGEQMEVIPPKIIETGELPTQRTSPSIRRNAALGLLGGMVLCAGIICLLTILDDTVKSEEDIEKYLALPVLAVIPDRKDYVTGNGKKGKGKKKTPPPRVPDKRNVRRSTEKRPAEKQKIDRVRPESGKEAGGKAAREAQEG